MTHKVAVAVASAVNFCGALGVVITGAVFCAGTLHVARKVGPATPGAETITIIAADHARLNAWWIRAAHPNGNCVVVLHGVTDSRVGSRGFAPMFLNEGYSVLLPDSRAHGTSGGVYVTYGLLEKYDVIAWARWMKSQGCGKLFGLGESMGASILIEATAVAPSFAAAIAESPYADLRVQAEYRTRQIFPAPAFVAAPIAAIVVTCGMLYARWVDGLNFAQVSPLRAIAQESTPILLIHGLADSRTPASNSERLARANPRNTLWLVPNARHTGAAAAAPEEFRKRVLGWFGSH